MSGYKSRLKTLYEKELMKSLMEDLGYSNEMSVPKLKKIVINMSFSADSKSIDAAADEMFRITGQKPVITLSKKAIAGFKLKQGVPIGCMVTLRKDMMYDFLDRLVNIALPRVKDFKGLSSKSFDGNGNYAFGLKEQIVFPEINYDRIDAIRGMDIVIVTSAATDKEAHQLLTKFKLPIK